MILAAFSILIGCSPEKHPNLLLISVDTLRFDAVSSCGGPEELTPNIDNLARSSMILGDCYTTCPRTTQSFASLFTGLYPTRHGAYGLNHRLDESVITLAEILRAAGYYTEAVISNNFLMQGRGFDQGFVAYDHECTTRELQGGTEVRLRFTDLSKAESDTPFFAWIHFMDPHWPYRPPDEVLERFDPEPGRLDSLLFPVVEDRVASGLTKGSIIFENDMSERDRTCMRRRYLSEVSYIDEQIGHLLELIDDRGLLDDTVVLFYSDHGESLGEHDYYFAHGEKLYQPTVKIPVFIRYPSGLKPGRYDGLTANIDLLPTILALMGIESPVNIDGIDMLDALRKGSVSPRSHCPFESDYQFIHPENPTFHFPGPQGKWRAVLSGHHKLIRIPDPRGDNLELYNILDDPEESHNLIEEKPETLAELLPILDDWEKAMSSQRAHARDLGKQSLDEQSREDLRSLGYLN